MSKKTVIRFERDNTLTWQGLDDGQQGTLLALGLHLMHLMERRRGRQRGDDGNQAKEQGSE